jgi:hypothetical protein
VNRTPKLGERVSFLYNGPQPFAGERISGEVVLVTTDGSMSGIYRDEPWRHADAVVTWVPTLEITAATDPLPSNDGSK